MSSAFKTLTLSDFTVLPYKTLKELEYESCYISNAGFRVYKGVNTPLSLTGSYSNEALVYQSIKTLFYQSQLSASLQSGSAYNDSLQSTAFSSSLQSDIRSFPTHSGATIKVLSVPQSIYGEAVSPRTFKLTSDTGAYLIVDDGNGNLIDIVDYLVKAGIPYSPGYYTDSIIYGTDLLYNCINSGSLVGNIIYAQGIIIITTGSYDCIFDMGPTVSDVYEVFLSTDTPKIISPLVTAVTDCSPIDASSLQLIPIPGQSFPSYIIVNGEIELLDSDPLTTTQGTYYINYKVASDVCVESNTALIVVSIIDCAVVGGVVTIQPTTTPTPTPTVTTTIGITPSVTPTLTPTLSITPTRTVTPTITPTRTVTPTITPTRTATPTPTITPTVTVTPTTTPLDYVTLKLCLWYENGFDSPGTLWYVLSAGNGGSLSGNPPNTDITATITVFLTTSGGSYTVPAQFVTLSASTYYTSPVSIAIPYNIASIAGAVITNINPTNSGGQYFVNGGWNSCSGPCVNC